MDMVTLNLSVEMVQLYADLAEAHGQRLQNRQTKNEVMRAGYQALALKHLQLSDDLRSVLPVTTAS